MDFNSLSCVRELSQVSVRSQLTEVSDPVPSIVVATAEPDEDDGGAGLVVVSFVSDSSETLKGLVVFWRKSSTSPDLHVSKMEGDNVITEY